MRRLLAGVHAEGYLAAIARICHGPDWREVWEHIGVETLGFSDLRNRALLKTWGCRRPSCVGAGPSRPRTSGMLVVTGPAGSGKTTTIYAQLQHIADAAAGLSIVTLEDPVERRLPGVTQIEVKPFGELTYERCLRSILRQDPQVLMLGEIRDPDTAALALSAALSGHRMICTLHAATPGVAIARLLEMGMEPYQISSSLFGVIAQRLVRKVSAGGGYAGRAPVAEFAPMTEELRRAVLSRSDAAALAGAVAARTGHVDLRQAASDLVSRGITDAAEVARVLGQ